MEMWKNVCKMRVNVEHEGYEVRWIRENDDGSFTMLVVFEYPFKDEFYDFIKGFGRYDVEFERLINDGVEWEIKIRFGIGGE